MNLIIEGITPVLAILSVLLISAGALFFCAGTAGLLRFPDVFSRLHALTKADNLGLGLLSIGLCLTASSAAVALKIVLVWLFALLASAVSCHLIARHAVRSQKVNDKENSP